MGPDHERIDTLIARSVATTTMNGRAWRRRVLILSAATILIASFALLQWNVHDPRPEALAALAVLGIGLAIVSAGFALVAAGPDE